MVGHFFKLLDTFYILHYSRYMSETKKLISNSSIVFAGTIIGSFFSYLFNMLAGRFLGPEKYGEFTALLSVMMILSVAGGAIMTVTMKYSSELIAKKYFHALNKLYKKFTKYTAIFAIFLITFTLIFVKPIGAFFSINDVVPICITLTSFFFGFLLVVNRGVLQGGQKFFDVTISTTLEMLLKLLIGVILIKIGLGVSGAMLGMILATAIIYFVSLLPLNKLLKTRDDNKAEEFDFERKEIVAYTIPALISSTFLMVALNMDIILVKHYFDPETAGIYAAVSTIAKIILYATGPIVSVMFPMISEKKTTGDKHYKLLLLSFLLTFVGGLIILVAYFVAPGSIIRLLYGASFTSYYSYLPQVGIFILLYSLVNIMANYYLVLKSYTFLYFFAFVVGLQLVLINSFHGSLVVVVKILISTTALLFALLFGYYLITKRAQLLRILRG